MIAPGVEFGELQALWIQVTGTLCNLACTHCLNASGPRAPRLAPLDAGTVRRALAEGEALGVKEIYFTGGEPFLHPEIMALLDVALAIAPATVLTNGTLLDDALAAGLTALAHASPYSLEIRVSLDGACAGEHDRVRGDGTFAAALAGLRRLTGHGLLPIVTTTDVWSDRDLYGRMRAMLLAEGVARPRIKILPLLPAGRARWGTAVARLTSAELDGLATARLMCAQTRVVAATGVYACPILAGLPGARLGDTLGASFGPVALFHPACRTCVEAGLTCSNG